MMSEKIEFVLEKRNKSKAWLARELNCSTSNLYNKLKRDNFSEKELSEIAKVLDCTFEAYFSLNDLEQRRRANMYNRKEEAKTIKPREYHLSLSDADVERIAKTAGTYGISVSELLENFIADLVDGTFTNGSDERMYAEQWAERCFAFQQEKNLIQYLCEGGEYDFSTLENLLFRINSAKASIESVENSIKNPDDSWKDLVYHRYNDDMTSYECVPCYSSFEEYMENRKQELSDYKTELEEAEQELEDFHEYFDKYMDGEQYNWNEEIKNATKWYAENISSKLD